MRVSVAFVPTVLPSNQNQASTPTTARPAIEQQSHVPSAAYPPTISSNQNQASTFTNARLANEEQRQPPPALSLQTGMSPGIVGRRAPAAYSPSIPSSQTQAGAPTRARPAVEQQNYVSPNAAYPATFSFNQHQASSPTRARPAIEQQNYGYPAAYPSTISSNQNQASTPTGAGPAVEQQSYVAPAAYPSTISYNQIQAGSPTRARPAIDQQSYTLLNRAPEHQRRDRSDFFATVLNPTNDNDTAPAREATFRFRCPSGQRTREHLDAVERDRATATSAEHGNRVRRVSQVKQRIQAGVNATLAMEEIRNKYERLLAEREEARRASDAVQQDRAQQEAIERNRAELAELEQARVGFSSSMPVLMANEDSAAAATPAARKNAARVFEAEQRAQAQRDAIERNKIALAARTQTRNTPWKPPTVIAPANSAVTALAEHNDSGWGSRIEQLIRAEVAATAAERDRSARLVAAREEMERVFEAEQRVRAQWDAIERNKAAASNPPILGTGLSTATAASAARDGEHAAARDSLMSSPVTASERAPFSQALSSSPGNHMIAPTALGQRSTVDQPGPRAARSRAELLQIRCRDPEYRELTGEERIERRKAMQWAYNKKRKRATSSK